MNHLEKLTRQYYDWSGYLVKGNVKVGRLARGGWAGELDVVAYHPQRDHLIHIEPSLDAHSWSEREERFEKKFRFGREYICKDVFPWLKKNRSLEQKAILVSSSRKTLGEASVISIDEFVKEIKEKVLVEGVMAKKAIPEEFDLLRTIQLITNGYHKIV